MLFTCEACGRDKEASMFYENRDSQVTGGLDAWCKDCVHAFVKDKETMQEYCRHNNREFNDELWEKCEQLAISDLDTGKVSGFKSESARNNYITRRAITDYFKQMNMVRWYKYDGEASGEQIPFMSSPIEEVQEWFDPDEEVYSDFWEGSYTRSELDRLNAMFKEYQDDFDIPDVHTRNMFKKVVKLSFLQDKATQDVLENPSKENVDQLDKITKMLISASDAVKLNLAKRTSNDRGGFTDLGSLIARVESTGALMRKVEFPPDDVDITLREYIEGISANLANEDIDDEIEEDEFNGS